MDAEVYNSEILRESFERSEASDDGNVPSIDVEKNLLKYLLESHASQMGGAGPASMLLQMLGANMPIPPKV